MQAICTIACLIVVAAFDGRAEGRSGACAAELANSDVALCFEIDAGGPRVASMIAGNTRFENTVSEALPASLEVNGTDVPLEWKLVPEAGSISKDRVMFIYESSKPRLRLAWVWESRAESGALEHFIKVENLSEQEAWLPMIDSLRLRIRYGSKAALDHVYVEKGANTPSDVGTHVVPFTDGYRWTGTSSTYALPIPGEPREIIPAEFVFKHEGAQDGWYAGIEFSGRTRIELERGKNVVSTVLGLNPEPGPFRTRLSPEEISSHQPLSWVSSRGVRMERPTS